MQVPARRANCVESTRFGISPYCDDPCIVRFSVMERNDRGISGFLWVHL